MTAQYANRAMGVLRAKGDINDLGGAAYTLKIGSWETDDRRQSPTLRKHPFGEQPASVKRVRQCQTGNILTYCGV